MKKGKDYVGFTFQDGSKVIGWSHSDGNCNYWKISCINCGTTSIVSSSGLRTRKTGYCHDCLAEYNGKNQIKDLSGQKFGKLTAVSMAGFQRGLVINAHHLDGFHWCIEKRYDSNNLVTLCKTCHRDFHSAFGNRNNTKEQFLEFLETI